MRNLLLTILVLTLTYGSFAQKTQKRFERAYKLSEEEKYDSALYLFTSIYNRGIGNPELIAKSYYNMASIYLELKDTLNAKRIFNNIIHADVDDMDRGGIGKGWMAEPYALYKNRSCNILASLALQDKDYVKALKYVEMADKEYPYVHFCGNEYAANDIYMATMYAKCYAGLGEIDRALKTLMPHCINNGLASNSYLVEQLCGLLKQKYSREELKQEINTALSGIYVRETKHSDFTDSIYCAKIFNTEFKLGNYSYYYDYKRASNFNGIELYREQFKESEFVKKLLQ